jgi:hypothetical protein
MEKAFFLLCDYIIDRSQSMLDGNGRRPWTQEYLLQNYREIIEHVREIREAAEPEDDDPEDDEEEEE